MAIRARNLTRIARSRLSADDRDRLNVDCALERMAHGRASIRSLRLSLASAGLSYDAIGARLARAAACDATPSGRAG